MSLERLACLSRGEMYAASVSCDTFPLQQLHAVVSGVTVTDLAAARARTQPNTSRYIVTKELFFHSE
jgi:hypothetical protein